MKRIASISLIYFLSVNLAFSEENWLPPASDNISRDAEWIEIPLNSYFEIPVSKLGAAEYWLADTSFLIQGTGEYFGRADFKCSENEKMYLIRALYENGGTGAFRLYWENSNLIVSHASLGESSPAKKSALIVCLPKEPKVIYSSLSGAL